MSKDQALIFELSEPERISYSLPELDVPDIDLDEWLPEEFNRKTEPELPEVSELQLMRHYTALSKRNHGVDSGFYPLGSCTMKYNPKINEDVARYPGFAFVHPLQEEETVQGALEMMYNLQENLVAVTGMDEVTLQPAAGFVPIMKQMGILIVQKSLSQTLPTVQIPPLLPLLVLRQ